MAIMVTNPDPSWRPALRKRDAILWLCPHAVELHGGDQRDMLQTYLRRTWRTVFSDLPDSLDREVETMECRDEELTLRFFVENAGPDNLPPNRLPVYWLRGEEGNTAPGVIDDPAAMLERLTMLKHAPDNKEVFVFGVTSEDDLEGVIEAARLSEAFQQLVIVTSASLDLSCLDDVAIRVFHWKTDSDSFRRYVTELANRDISTARQTLLIRGQSGLLEVDFSSCVDPSHPITSEFELISSEEIQQERNPSVDDVKAFLEDPTHSWLAYASGIPFPRHPEYEQKLLKYLKRFVNEGPSLSCTTWLPAEDGSGATTALRQLLFNIAREGFPVLLARPGMTTLDFKQLSAFLRQAASRLVDQNVSPSELPWVVAFDTEHTQLMWETVRSLANGLKNLMRSVVVLAVQPADKGSGSQKDPALGENRKLGDVLESTVTEEEGVLVGEHLSKYLPRGARREQSEWRRFISDAARPDISGSHSLFWVALHFWLFRVQGTNESLRRWLANKMKSLVANDPHRYRALLEIAVLGKHRLPAPVTLLTKLGASSLISDADVLDSPIGLRRITERGGAAYSFAHPLVAEELLRIAEGDNEALLAVGMSTCLNLLDLELHLLGGLLCRPAAGTTVCLPLIEELVTSALRVDPREAPRNYQARDRIVEILEEANPSLWDTSQVFNHHVAKARRHLAVAPPDSRWTVDMCREQLDLAVSHLDDAICNINPPCDSHRESDLNLCVSMALTFDARARIEDEEGLVEDASRFRKKSEEFYLRAQKIDADNSYVLENFARHKLRIARSLPVSEERIRLIVEAISLLELEQLSDDLRQREYATMEELANAYTLFDDSEAEQRLGKLAAMGSEPALVALAKLELRRSKDDTEEEQQSLADAESILLRVPAGERSWRTLLMLYHVISKSSRFDFPRRLDLLEQLDATKAFAWPQQLRLEYGILLFQAGDTRGRKKGADVYKLLRDEMPARSAAARVPHEMKFLRDPRTQFRKSLKTFIVVKNLSDVGRTSYGVPDGWGSLGVAFRARLFGRDRINLSEELDCFIQFTNFGPQAVPLTEEEQSYG